VAPPKMPVEMENYYIENYARLGPTKMSTRLGKSKTAVQAVAQRLRNRLRDNGDERWLMLVSRKAALPEEIIVDYGVVHVPDIYADKDPRPVWLVITDPRFNTGTVALERADRAG